MGSVGAHRDALTLQRRIVQHNLDANCSMRFTLGFWPPVWKVTFNITVHRTWGKSCGKPRTPGAISLWSGRI